MEKYVALMLASGLGVNYGKYLSIDRIERGLHRCKIQYQVNASYKSFQFSHLYDDLDIAVDKFMLVYQASMKGQ